MPKSFKVLSLALGVVVLLGALGIGTAFAADPPATSTSSDYFTAFMAKVAQYAGVDQQKLTDAFTKARTETRDEMIDQAVKDGRMTQDRADRLKQQPNDGTLGPGFAGGFGGPMMRGSRGGGAAGAPFGGPAGAPFGPWAQSTPAPAQ